MGYHRRSPQTYTHARARMCTHLLRQPLRLVFAQVVSVSQLTYVMWCVCALYVVLKLLHPNFPTEAAKSSSQAILELLRTRKCESFHRRGL